MPLFNLSHNRNNVNFKKPNLNKSQKVNLYHDTGVIIEETIESVHEWVPSTRRHVGSLDCTNNPPFPEATDGEMYTIVSDGTVGSYKVQKGDCIECIVDYSPEGYGENIRANWFINSIYKDELPDPTPPDISDIPKDCVHFMHIDITNSGKFNKLPVGTIIRRVWIYINEEYKFGNEFKFRVNNEEITVPVHMKGDAIECMQGIKCILDSNIEVSVLDYTSGKATIILEYYMKDAKETDIVKTIHAELNTINTLYDNISIPANAIITSCAILPDKCNTDACIYISINGNIIEHRDLTSFFMLYEYYHVLEQSIISIEVKKINMGSVNIILEYSA